MSTRIERRSLRDDLIDDIVEPSASHNPISSFFIDSVKIPHNQSYSSLPLSFNKTKFEQTNDHRDRSHLTSSRGNSSHTMSNDERRKEIDLIIKHVYDGKLLTANTNDRTASDNSEPLMHMLSRGAITTTTIKNDEESKNHDLLILDGDIASLQRELKEKELDITHLHKEIQELQLENKLLKAKGPSVYSNGYTNNNNETEALRRERDILKNELFISQEVIAKFQQQHQHFLIKNSNILDEITLHQQETFENKLKSYEKQIRMLVNENEIFKQNFHQTERIIIQLKNENDELQQKINESKKRNDELFYQEFHSLRQNLKMLKERNNELFQENLRLQHGQSNIVRRSSNPEQQVTFSSQSKLSNSDSKHFKNGRSESPNISEASDSTNYLTSISADRYNTRPASSIYRSQTADGNNHHRTARYSLVKGQEDNNRNINSIPLSRSFDQQFIRRSSKAKHATEWNEENIQSKEGLCHRDILTYDDDHPTKDNTKVSQFLQSSYPGHRSTTSNESRRCSRRSINSDTNSQQDDRRQTRGNTPTTSPKRPYAPSSISDIRLNDIIKFSRPGGKVSKGSVKYIGLLPGKTDQYLGLELEDEESKHDGIYQDQRLFQCKPNKGVFVGFNKVIMAWGGQ